MEASVPAFFEPRNERYDHQNGNQCPSKSVSLTIRLVFWHRYSPLKREARKTGPKNTELLAGAIEALAFTALGLAASAGTQILLLDIVAGVAVGVVVVDGLLDRMPRGLLRHCAPPNARPIGALCGLATSRLTD